MAENQASNIENAGAGLFAGVDAPPANNQPANAGAPQDAPKAPAEGAQPNADGKNAPKEGDNLLNPGEKKPEGQADPKAETKKDGEGEGEKKPEQTPEEKKAAEEAAKVPQKWEDYTFTVPEGMELNKEIATEFAKAAHGMKMPQGQAQAFVGMYAKGIQQAMKNGGEGLQKNITEEFQKTHKGWVDSLKADNTYGGPNYQKTLEKANWALMNVIPEAYRHQAADGLRDNPLTMIALSLAAEGKMEGNAAPGNTNGQKQSAGGLFGNL